MKFLLSLLVSTAAAYSDKSAIWVGRASSVLARDEERWGPSFAIDGKISNSKTKLFISGDTVFPWLEVGLPSPTNISNVTIVNRVDCCGNRLKNVEVRAGMEKIPDGFKGQKLEINTVCGHFAGPGENGATYVIICDTPILAKYITIQLLERNYLRINEMTINKEPIVQAMIDIQENGENITQIATYDPNQNILKVEVPAHGNYTRSILFMAGDKGETVLKTGNECFLSESPDLDVMSMAAQMDDLVRGNISFATNHMIKARQHEIGDEDRQQLSGEVQELCRNKSITKTMDSAVTEEEYNNLLLIQDNIVIVRNSSSSGRRKRQSHSCNLERACTRPTEGPEHCWYWPNPDPAGSNVYGLHHLGTTVICVECCLDDTTRPKRSVTGADCCVTSYPNFCRCQDITTHSKLEACSKSIPVPAPKQNIPTNTIACITIGGGDIGSRCVFPFIFNGISYDKCTTVDGDDPWCSTLTNAEGEHVSGEGKWGYCPSDHDSVCGSMEQG